MARTVTEWAEGWIASITSVTEWETGEKLTTTAAILAAIGQKKTHTETPLTTNAHTAVTTKKGATIKGTIALPTLESGQRIKAVSFYVYARCKGAKAQIKTTVAGVTQTMETASGPEWVKQNVTNITERTLAEIEAFTIECGATEVFVYELYAIFELQTETSSTITTWGKSTAAATGVGGGTGKATRTGPAVAVPAGNTLTLVAAFTGTSGATAVKDPQSNSWTKDLEKKEGERIVQVWSCRVTTEIEASATITLEGIKGETAPTATVGRFLWGMVGSSKVDQSVAEWKAASATEETSTLETSTLREGYGDYGLAIGVGFPKTTGTPFSPAVSTGAPPWSGGTSASSGAAAGAPTIVTDDGPEPTEHAALKDTFKSGSLGSNEGYIFIVLAYKVLEPEHTFSRSVADTIGLAESVVVNERKTPRALTDTVALAENTKGTSGTSRATTDTMTITDAVTRTQNMTRSFTEPGGSLTTGAKAILGLGLTGMAVTGMTYPGAAGKGTASINLSENIEVKAARNIADTIHLTESMSRAVSSTRSLTDLLTIADTTERVSTTARAASDTVTLTETVKGGREQSRNTEDHLAINEAIIIGHGFPRSTEDTITILDNAQRTFTAQRSLTDTVTLTELVSTLTVEIPSVGLIRIRSYPSGTINIRSYPTGRIKIVSK